MTAPVASFSGISSGINFRDLVDQLITLDRRPAVQMERQIASLRLQKTTWGTYRENITTLTRTADALRTGTALSAVSASVQGTGAGGRPLVSATAQSGAALGTYRVQVTSLATAGAAASRTFASDTAALNYSGTFTVNGQTVTVDAADGLNGIRDKINALNTGATPTGVTASVVNTGSGFRLALRATSTGAAGFSVSGTVLTDAAQLGATVTNGTDASFTVDGIALTRSTNTVSDAIQGVTLNLLTAEPGTEVQVQVARDGAATRKAVQDFVDAYNVVQSFMRGQQPTPGATTQPPLVNETALNLNRGQLVSVLQGQVDTGVPSLSRLQDIGISIGRDGALTFNAAKFDAAQAANPAAVSTLFADRMGALKAITDGVTQSGSGLVASRQASIDRQIERMQSRIDDLDQRLERRRAGLIQQFSRMEAALNQIRLQGASLVTQSASLSQ